MKNIIKISFGIIISVLFVYLAMKDVQFTEVWRAFTQAKFFYYIFVVMGIFLVFTIRTLRWQILLAPLKKISFYNLYSTVWISFMMLLIMPARLGEFARAYLVGKKENISKTGAFSSIVIERIFDGCASILMFIVAVIISPQSSSARITFDNMPVLSDSAKMVFKHFFEITTNPNNTVNLSFPIINLVYLVSIFYAAALVFVVLLRLFKNKTVSATLSLLFFLPVKIKDKISEILFSFIKGLDCLTDVKSLCVSIFYSLLIWGITGTYMYLMLLSFGIEPQFHVAFIILGFTVIGVMIPAAPGFIGTYHYMIMIAFKYYVGDDKNVAASYAWVSWAIGTLGTIAVGLYYLKKEKLTISSLTGSSK